MSIVKNAQGQIFYGMHFCPGVVQYDEPGKETLRVFLNENTIRKMSPTFAGRPVFVEHVDEVDDDLDEIRNEADGWVVESFFNEADGKTWAKFIVVSERGLTAIRRGFRLSNAYFPKSYGESGLWNGVPYQKAVTDGEFEHLAIVRNPRYEESVIMTPDEFKAYNEAQKTELKRIANSKDHKGEKKMGLSLFKRTKVENSTDLAGMIVALPLSKKEVSVEKALNEYDKFLNMNGYANEEHMVKVNDKDEMSVKDLVKAHQEKCNEIEKMKKDKDGGDDLENEDPDMEEADPGMENDDSAEIEDEGVRDLGDHGGDKSLDNADEEDEGEDKEKAKKKNSKKITNADVLAAKKVLAKAKAQALKNANHNRADEETVRISLPGDQIARGKARYGSN